jgi:CheY-like chemotaxis protein
MFVAGNGKRLNGRILVVDDDPSSRRLLIAHLTRAGADVTGAEDGQMAIEGLVGQATQRRGFAAAAPKFDLLVIDMNMPRLDGYQAVPMLRSRGFGRPIIAVSGDTKPEDHERCRHGGCDAFLLKPVAPETLIEHCARLLGGAREAA